MRHDFQSFDIAEDGSVWVWSKSERCVRLEPCVLARFLQELDARMKAEADAMSQRMNAVLGR